MSSSRTSTPPANSRSQTKSASMSAKATTDLRKQNSSSPMEQSDRKPAIPAAWSKGSTNPVTQRPVGSVATNGATSGLNRPAGAQKSKDSSHMNFLLINAIGRTATFTLNNGSVKYKGIFSGHTNNHYTLKMVRKTNLDDAQINGPADEAYVGNGPDFTKSFPVHDGSLYIQDLKFDQSRRPAQNGASRFKTDTDISTGKHSKERQLQAWVPDDSVPLADSLESSSNGKEWDQFAANKSLFGAQTNYKDEYYTTTIDREAPGFKEREAKAEKLAREIEGQSSSNPHIAEERNQKPADEAIDEDEESKYSGVRRSFEPLAAGQTNKYTPPARRPPSSQTTVSGAPVDPAIISSSLAKSDKAIPPQTKDSNGSPSKPVPLAKSPNPDESTKSASKTLGDKALSSTKSSNATSTVEKDVVSAFKQFRATENLRAQEAQRANAKRDKAVKINDLKKFAQNFKLRTPVPDDLVPILAKDKDKRDKIEQAHKNAVEGKPASSKASEPTSSPSSSDTKAAKPIPSQPSSNNNTTNNSKASTPAPAEQRPNLRNRQSQQSPYARGGGAQSNNVQRNHPSQLSQNLQKQYPRASMGVMPLQDHRIPPTGPAMQMVLPNQQIRQGQQPMQFIPRAPEFRPNPSAHTFQPGPFPSNGSSPVREARRPQFASFLAGRRPILSSEERVSLKDSFNIVSTQLAQAKTDGKDKESAALLNGGFMRIWVIPTWDVPEPNKNKTYVEVFEKQSPTATTQHNGPQSISHQSMTMHVQGPHHSQHHTPRHPPAQPYMGPGHHDDNRMQHTYSNSSIHTASPRTMHQYTSPGQGTPNMYAQPMSGYQMTPGGYPMNMRQVSGGPGMMPNSNGPQIGGHMMTPQASSGPYLQPMNQVPVYPQIPAQGYPHNGQIAVQTVVPQGFPSSPRPMAQMMVPQGSQVGHQPIMYIQGSAPVYGQGHVPGPPMRPQYGAGHQSHYGTSPHQMHPYPNQSRGTPSAHYVQPIPQGHNMPSTLSSNNGVPVVPVSVDGVEDAWFSTTEI